MASYHSSTLACSQQSLLRSLSAIHRPLSPTSAFDNVSNKTSQQEISPSQGCSPKKSQRRRATVTAAGARQPMMAKITSEKRRERRRTMEARMTANDDSNALNKSRRRASVTFTPLPPSSSIDEKQTITEEQHKHENGFRGDYTIGETIRSSSHMSIEPTSEKVIQAIGSLAEHDFAFIKRSDGSYSYAILAYRSMEPVKGADINETESVEECMTFVMSEAGATKMVRRRNWSKLVRLVRASSSSS